MQYEAQFLTWSDADQDHALYAEMHRRETCAGCGTHPADWDPERGGHPRAFVAALYPCPGCLSLAALRRSLDAQPEITRDGVHVILVPNPDL